VGSIVPILLLGLAGLLVGGAISMARGGASRLALVIVSLLALLAAAGGVFWLLPKG
jgi:hypothetical protein